MAEDGGTSRHIERGAGRLVRGGLVVLLSLLLIGAWVASSGYYRLKPGEAAVVLRLGRYTRTVETPGFHFKLPLPFETKRILRLGELRRVKFGFVDSQQTELGDDPGDPSELENAIQTADNNVVMMSYVVQYYVADPFLYEYGMANGDALLRDAAQSVMREVIGRRPGRDALKDDRGGIQADAEVLLQERLDGYFTDAGSSPFRVQSFEILDSQAPAPVRDAFDDVQSANQDQERAQAEARGDAREIVERALAEAQETRESAVAYRDAKLVEARGEAERFVALHVEYERAPEVTRRRLYLETMEQILPGVEKVIVEKDTVNLLPYFPVDRRPGTTP